MPAPKFEDTVSSSAQRKLIINGDSTLPSDHQFFLRSWPDTVRETNDILCGGSLIHSDIILTAAHCHGGFNYGVMAYNPNSGELDRYTTVDLQIAYPNYYANLNIINYDIMIMRLSSPIIDVEPVMLNADPNFPVGRKSTDQSYLLEALGVGLTETGFVSQGLQIGFFNAIANDQCSKRLGSVNVAIANDVMCADPFTDDSICSGDSGGPLTAKINLPNENNGLGGSPWHDNGFGGSPWSDNQNSKAVQVGVTSFGNDCEVDHIPDGFARISYFHEWITKQICKYSRDPPVECFEYFRSEEYLEFVAQDASLTIWPDKARIRMKFQHDFSAEQTVFVFRDAETNEIEYVGPQYVPQRGEFVESTFHLSVPGNYAIEIHDNGGDGLTNPFYANSNYPQGSWTISAEYSNGAVLEDLASGEFEFESLQTQFIRLPRRMSSPIFNPSQSVNPTTTPMPTTPIAAWERARGEVDGMNMEPQISSSSPLLKFSTWVFTFLTLGLAGFL